MIRIQRNLVRWFSRRVGNTKRERLERTMRAPVRRRALLGLIFRAMPRAVRRRAMDTENVVVGWRITGGRDGEQDRRQLVIGDGQAVLQRDWSREADLTITIDGVDFLLVATGNADPSALFVKNRLDIDGDPWLAMRLPKIFAAPGAG